MIDKQEFQDGPDSSYWETVLQEEISARRMMDAQDAAQEQACCYEEYYYECSV